MPFRIGFKPRARLIQGYMLANTGDDILQGPLLRAMIKHIIDGDQRDFRFPGKPGQGDKVAAVLTSVQHGRRQPGVPPQGFQQRLDRLDFLWRHHDQQQPIAAFQQVGQIQKTVAFGRPQFSLA